MPRLPYLDITRDDLPEQDRPDYDLLRKPDGRMLNLNRILAYRPNLLMPRRRYSRALNADNPTLEAGLRQLLLLVVGSAARCTYEYFHHVHFAQRDGLSAEKIMALPVWEHHPAFSEAERSAIRYTEEMTLNIRVADA